MKGKPEIRAINGTLAKEDIEKAEILNKYFATVGQQLAMRAIQTYLDCVFVCEI